MVCFLSGFVFAFAFTFVMVVCPSLCCAAVLVWASIIKTSRPRKPCHTPVPSPVSPKNALISVADKTGLTTLAKDLIAHGFTLYATGGSSTHLTQADLPHQDITALTNMPEMMDGRVKTLHPAIHGGILADRSNPDHQKDMATDAIQPIDLVVCNLYPFFERLEKPEASTADLIESIDIGGVTLIRGSAKNHAHVAILTDPADYPVIIKELAATASITSTTRTRLAAKAIAYTAAYDSVISHWLAGLGDAAQDFPPRHFTLGGEVAQPLRYGENPQQMAAVYRIPSARVGAKPKTLPRLIQGKPMGYNNLVDCDAAMKLVAEFTTPSLAIIKHGNPCGVAVADTIKTAWEMAYAADPVSAFGGIVALNGKLDVATAQAMADKFIEAIIAPDAEAEAVKILVHKRILVADHLPNPSGGHWQTRLVTGGFLLQAEPAQTNGEVGFDVVTKRQPSPEEKDDMVFAWRVAKHVTSNAIVFAKNHATTAIGAGQMSRIDAMRIAIAKAHTLTESPAKLLANTSLASDGFFPFADSITAAAEAGATAIIQPGGSKRDDEVIAEADKHNLAMAFTGQRVFRH